MKNFKDWFDYRNLILELRYDAIESTIQMTIVEDPDTLQPQATFVSKGVTKLDVDRFHDPDFVTMGDCEKYDVKKEGEIYAHEIWTGDAVIKFKSTGIFEEESQQTSAGDVAKSAAPEK